MKKPWDVAQSWQRQRFHERVKFCVLLLSGHGFMTDAETRKIKARILKWEEAHKPER
jgi:hypothetical protein